MARTSQTREFFTALGAHWKPLGDTEVIAHFGDPAAEYDAVVARGLGVIERGERETLVLSGDDTVPWLQGLVTSDLRELEAEGSGQRTSLVNTTGRFVGEARVVHLPQMLLLDLEPGSIEGGLLSHFRRHIIMEKVEISDRSEATARLGLIGSEALGLLTRLCDWGRDPAKLKPFHATWGMFEGEDLILQRVIWSELPFFDLICDARAVPKIVDALRERADDLPLFGYEAFETFRVEAGVPRFGAELHEKVIPLEAGFEDAIAYDKGCYLGQEIIARLDSRGTPAKMLRRVILESDNLPAPDSPVLQGDGSQTKIGDVISFVYSPKFKAPVALAFVKRKFNDVGAAVEIDGQKGRLEGLLDLRSL